MTIDLSAASAEVPLRAKGIGKLRSRCPVYSIAGLRVRFTRTCVLL